MEQTYLLDLSEYNIPHELYQHLIGLTEKNELIYMIYPVEVIDKIDSLKGFDNPILAYCKLSR